MCTLRALSLLTRYEHRHCRRFYLWIAREKKRIVKRKKKISHKLDTSRFVILFFGSKSFPFIFSEEKLLYVFCTVFPLNRFKKRTRICSISKRAKFYFVHSVPFDWWLTWCVVEQQNKRVCEKKAQTKRSPFVVYGFFLYSHRSMTYFGGILYVSPPSIYKWIFRIGFWSKYGMPKKERVNKTTYNFGSKTFPYFGTRH